MKFVTGTNIPSDDVITIARLASVSGISILMKLQSPSVKMNVITSFAGIMFILENIKDPKVLSSLVYAIESGKTRVIEALALGRRKWKITVENSLGNQSNEILKLPLRFFVPRSNFKFLSQFPELFFQEIKILKLEGTKYDIT
mgnify:CR=1 FL=1